MTDKKIANCWVCGKRLPDDKQTDDTTNESAASAIHDECDELLESGEWDESRNAEIAAAQHAKPWPELRSKILDEGGVSGWVYSYRIYPGGFPADTPSGYAELITKAQDAYKSFMEAVEHADSVIFPEFSDQGPQAALGSPLDTPGPIW